MREAADKAARADRRTAPTSTRAAFDRVLEEAGGNVDNAKAIVLAAQREESRSRQRIELAYSFETPEEYAERMERMREADRQRFLAAAAIPLKYQAADVSDTAIAALPEMLDGRPVRHPYGEAVATLRDSIRAAMQRPKGDRGAILVLLGERGPGKSYIACGLVREHCRRVLSARYGVTVRYFSALKNEFKPGGDVEKVKEQYRDPHLLVLDEIQVKSETKFQADELTDLIDHRYSNDRITILIGNVVADALPDLIGDSVYDRIHDGGGLIPCEWPSLRGRQLTESEAA